MNYIDIVAMLAVLQYLVFSGMVGAAREKYGVKAPAITGNEMFERIYRVQMNTLEVLVAFIPVLYAASHYWPQEYVASGGVIYLIGRQVYRRAYIKEPSKRRVGFAISILPIFALALSALVAAFLSSGIE